MKINLSVLFLLVFLMSKNSLEVFERERKFLYKKIGGETLIGYTFRIGYTYSASSAPSLGGFRDRLALWLSVLRAATLLCYSPHVYCRGCLNQALMLSRGCEPPVQIRQDAAGEPALH